MSDSGPTNERWDRTWEIFHELLGYPVESRAVQARKLCAGDAALEAEVEELLEAHDEGLSVLDTPPPVPDDLAETAVADRGFLAPGTVLADRFEIIRLIGVGGMGEVYEARDRELGNRVAVKTLLSALSADEAALARFRKEILLARQVTHRNACRIFDLFQDDDLVFLTMELLEGETLAAKLKRDGALELPDIETILEQLVAGLEAAHTVGVTHRDLKPSNVLLVMESGGLRVVITDFGLATSHGGESPEDVQLTRTGEVIGTPAYMAPEQLEGGDTGPPTDIYALGLMLYEMVTGRLPFEGGTAFSIASRRLQEPPPSPSRHVPNLSDRWESVIMRCLEREPAARFTRPDDVVAGLNQRVAPAPVRDTVRSGVWWKLAAAMVLVIGLFALWRAIAPDRDRAEDEVSVAGEAELAPRRLDTVLIADFENLTNDPRFDGVLESALARELAVSQVVAVATQRRIADSLRLMRLPDDSPVDAEVGREVALRDGGIRAVITGSIQLVGEETVLTASLVAPADGSVLQSFSAHAGAASVDLPRALRELSRELRESLGENLKDIESGEADLEKVTTYSFRALRLYEEAEAVIARSGQDDTSEELLREAVRDDPDFASAHLLLGYAVYNQTRDTNAAMPHFERAMELADDVPDRERYFIRATFFYFSGDVDKSFANYDALLRLHPDHYWGNNNMGALSGATAGIPYHVRKATYRPNDLDANWDAAHALAIVGNRPEEAQPFIDRIVELAEIEIPRWQDHEAAWGRLWKSHQLWLRGDLEGARSELDYWTGALGGMSGNELGWMRRALVQSYRALGMVSRARDLMPLPDYRLEHRFFSGLDALLAGRPEIAADSHGGDGWSERWWGDVLVQDPLRVTSMTEAGMSSGARAVISSFDEHSRAPTPTLADPAEVLESLMSALLEHSEGRLEEAVGLLEGVMSYDRDIFSSGFFLSASTLADAYEQLGRVDEAVAVLERAVAQKGRSYPFGMELWMKAKLELAALYRRVGSLEEAERLERELTALTRLADADFWLVERLGAE